MKPRKRENINKFLKSPIKWAMFGLVIGAVFATVGSVGALNGWFGGGGSIPSDTMTRGLVGYWGLEEGSGQVAHDGSDYSNNGVFGANAAASTDDPSWDKGKVGSGIKLDGSADYVSVADSASLNSVDAITISAWINPSGWGSGGGYGHIVSKSPDASITTGYGFYISQSDTDALKFYANNGGMSIVATNAISLNQWQYVTVTYDRQYLKLFVNGLLKNSVAETDAITTNTSSVLMGVRISGSYYFDGYIDDVRIYNRVLSDAEVRHHYNRGGPVAQWKFDEGEGRTAYDSTENNNDGTLILAGSATSSAWVAGKYGSALNLDGTDDYVKSGSNLTAVSSFSHSLWFKSADGAYSSDEYLLSQGINDPSIFVESTDNKVYVMADNANILSSNTLVNDNKWRHAEVTADGTVIKLYLDGILQSQAAYTGSSVAGLLYVGSNATPGSYFGGIVDDARIYNYARTPDEIRLDYNAGFAAKFGYTVAGCQKDPASCMSQGLVGYWSFDEGSGQIARDSSDYSNNGSLGANVAASTDDPSWDKGKVGGGIKLDGSADFVTVADSDSLDITDAITMEAWINPSSVSDSRQGIIVKTQSGTDMPYQFLINNDGIRTTMRKDSTYYEGWTNTGVVSLGEWQHIAVTIQVGEAAKFYRNGILQRNTNQTIFPTFPITASALWLGWGQEENNYYYGLIDEVRVYNRALSAEEVRYHYNKGAPVLQWKLDEGEGRTAYDSTENNNDGTLILAGSATSSAWVAGKYGSALNLDGTDDYVKSGSNLTAVSSFSHSLWFKSADGAYSSDEYLLSQGTNDPSIFVESTDNKVYVMADNANILSSNTLVNDNKWRHAEVTADGTVIKLYLDGILQSQAAYTGSSVAGLLYVGSNATPGSYFGGTVDDARIYNYARTPDEIRLDYNAGFAAKFGYTAAGCQKDPASCMTQGSMGYWNMDEGSGTAIHDSSDYSNNGTTTNMTTPWTSGIVPLSGGKKGGSALSFDGSDDYVAIPTISISNEITAETWVYSTNYNQSMFVVQKAPVNTQWELFFESGFLKWRGGSTDTVSCANPADNQWHHLTATQSGTTAKLYIDGKQCNSGAVAAIGNGTGLIDIGRHDASGYFFNGYIDEVRLYNRVLSSEEVRYHYNRGGPVAQWKFDEGEGRKAYDSTENNNDGTLVLAGSATSSAWVSGKYGSALNFDGTDDYVKSGSNLTAVSSFSHSLWFKSADGAYSADEYLLSQGTNDPSVFVESTDNKVYVMADNANILSSNTAVNDTKWHHVQTTADGAIIKLYLDGILQSQAAYTGSSAAGLLYAGSSATPNLYFSGTIDDVRVYNYARTPSQVQQDYNAGLSTHFR